MIVGCRSTLSFYSKQHSWVEACFNSMASKEETKVWPDTSLPIQTNDRHKHIKE